MTTPVFAPQLYCADCNAAAHFYQHALNAIELRRWMYEGRVHVVELQLGAAIFHLHEDSPHAQQLNPQHSGSTTVVIGLFVPDVAGLHAQALAAGGIETSPVTDWDYGYRQSSFTDPAGHHWQLEQKLDAAGF